MKRFSLAFALILPLLINPAAGGSANLVGDLQVTCEAGVRVFLDGNLAGKATADQNGLFIEAIPPGLHKVKAVKTGFPPIEMNAEVVAGKAKEVKIIFDRQSSEVPPSPTQSQVPSSPQPVETFTEPSTGIQFVLIKGGCYKMGDTFGDGYMNERPAHDVCLDDFWIGKYEVTQEEWEKVMGEGNNPSRFLGPRNPVEQVGLMNVNSFLEKARKLSGKPYRLPTEAEWEYAARSGGKQERFPGSNSVEPVAWYWENAGRKTHPVGEKAPNGLGLYDMAGNVLEWCSDYYDPGRYWTDIRGVKNPRGAATGEAGVLRGGAWYFAEGDVRTTNRIEYEATLKPGILGFRAVISSGFPK